MSEARIHCFTSASLAYLDRARVLGESLRRHHPDWVLWLCLVDQAPSGFRLDLTKEPFDHVLPIDALDIPDLRRWMFGHDVVELCTAVKGPMLLHLLSAGARKVVYLDPDIAVFGRLDEIEARLDESDLLLTPHLLAPETARDAILDNEVGAMKHGIFNLGFIAVAASAEGRRFAHWWRDRLLEFCIDDVPSGIFTDQRWCDHVPVFFPGADVLRDPGYNVASWNLTHRPLSIGPDGVIRAAGQPLRFFHFTKFNGVGRRMLERHAGTDTALHELMAWYANSLAAQAPVGIPPDWWAFGRYADDQSIPRAHRRQYRADPQLRERFPNPFEAGGRSLAAHLGQD
ncbi:hypothetical protein [Neoroseomonas soli]|uniref:Glycosyl transferase n=1 Tax=Neoroseomonas soli TaxID=1081025 RepID=A0A9X9X353_9PROT|nr:hypothetical protein [Neoroseomonas soli]MBR0673832.1 hypothetical protein [Neoroseomonas soli]